jgi:ELWxxDGT repeat protein
MSRFGRRSDLHRTRAEQRKSRGFAFTVAELEQRTMMSVTTAIVPGINQLGSFPANVTSSGDKPYFVTQGSSQGTVLPWATDGLPASSPTASTTTVDATLSFVAQNGSGSNQLLPAAGTAMVTTLPKNGVQFGGASFFENTSVAGPVISPIFRSDGTPGGASAIFTPDSSTLSMTGLVVSGNALYFLTTESGHSGTAIELWKSDGTSSGTAVLASIPAGQYSLGAGNLTDANGTLFFIVDTGSSGTATGHYELWSSDGTAAGTTEVTSLNGPLAESAALKNELVFAQPGPAGSAAESLWVSDGTSSGTVQLHDFPPSASSSLGFVNWLTSSGGALYFVGSSGSDLQLWRTDGTVAGTLPLTTANDGSGGVLPKDLVDMGGKLYFLGNDAASGQRALWTSDGTAVGTNIIADLGGTEASYSLGWGFFGNSDRLFASGSSLFIIAGDQSTAELPELWVSDGTPAGTTDAGSLPQSAYYLTPDDAPSFFAATDSRGPELSSAQVPSTQTPKPTPTPTPTPKSAPAPAPTPTPSSPSPAPTSTSAPKSPAPTPTPTPAPTIIGERAIFQRRVNKRGKPMGKAVLTGFALEFSGPMAASVLNAADYQLEEVRANAAGKNKLVRLSGVGLTVSYDTSSNTATVNLAGKHSFLKGGVLAVNTAVASAAGKSLGGSSTFAISPGGKNIGPA